MSGNVSILGLYKNAKLDIDELEVAYLVRIDSEGYAYVQCQNNQNEQRAYAVNDVVNQRELKGKLPVPVVILYDHNRNPIIINMLLEKFSDAEAHKDELELILQQNDRTETRVLNLEAQEAIHLRCGKSEITLRKNGKIVIKGLEMTSRTLGSF